MNWITDLIAVGGYGDLDKRVLEVNGIRRVLVVIPTARRVSTLAPVVMVAPWHDDKNLTELYQALYFIDEAVENKEKILVACGAGIERSPTTVVAYFIYKGFSLQDAVNIVQGAHPASQIRDYWLTDVGFNIGLPEVF